MKSTVYFVILSTVHRVALSFLKSPLEDDCEDDTGVDGGESAPARHSIFLGRRTRTPCFKLVVRITPHANKICIW